VPRIVALISAHAHAIARATILVHEHAGVYANPRISPGILFKDNALFFSTGEEFSQPSKHANKIIISIF